MERDKAAEGTASEATVFISTEAPLIAGFGGTSWELSFWGASEVSDVDNASIRYLTDRQTGDPNLRIISAGKIGASAANKFTSFSEMATKLGFRRAEVLSYVGFDFKHGGGQVALSIRDVVVAFLRR